MQLSAPLVPALKSNWLMMHVTVMLLSYSALMVGSLLAIAFLIVTRGEEVILQGSSFGSDRSRLNHTVAFKDAVSMRTEDLTVAVVSVNGNGRAASASTLVMDKQATERQPLSLQRLSLGETLDNLSYRTIGLGFPLLTIGIIAGAVWANEAWGSYWSWDPKETWSLITWLVFAAYLHTRITKGWQGRKPALLASAGLFVIWTCYLGVNLLGKGLHSYGWFL
jgi:cytochrome c-type biogenesis protein CcsB